MFKKLISSVNKNPGISREISQIYNMAQQKNKSNTNRNKFSSVLTGNQIFALKTSKKIDRSGDSKNTELSDIARYKEKSLRSRSVIRNTSKNMGTQIKTQTPLKQTRYENNYINDNILPILKESYIEKRSLKRQNKTSLFNFLNV